MFAYPQQTRQITCPSSHYLMQIDDLCQLYGGQSYTQNKYFCDTCRGEFHSKSHPSSHCMTCGFDMCPNCYEAQKFVQISCPQNHPLLKVPALQKFSNYSSNRYKCNSCKVTLDSTVSTSAHCRTCKYDLCPNCLANAQSQPQMNLQPSYQQQEHVKMSGNPSSMPFRQITCKNNHILSPVNNLKQLHPNSWGGYGNNIFACDTCRKNYTCTANTVSHHCSTCKFDMCSSCYEAQKTIRTFCPKSHPLFLVTAIKAFANYSSNTYRCNSCLSNWDAARNPSAHCPSCNYDLCPNCLASDQSQQQMGCQPPRQEQEQIKRSGNPSSSVPFRQITCTNNHVLNPVNNLNQLHSGLQGTYTLNMYVCDTCRRKYTCSTSPTYHCTTCKFDMCPGCYEAQKIIKTSCPKSHPLFLVTALKAFANYNSNTYRCNSCLSSFDAAQNPPAHCKTCSYDLCPKCLAKTQAFIPNNDEREQMQRDGNLKQVTCPSRHILSPVNNLHQLHPSSGGSYASNVYFCDTCRLNFKCQVDNSYHCQTCKFDVCPYCYQKDQRVNFDCSAGHPLYIVSNLKAFNGKTNSYVQNNYVCNSCRGSWDAALNPSCHCRLCKFDLCPNCFEARKNQIEQMKNNQYQNMQMQQNYNQMPQNNNQYNQMQQNNFQQYQVQPNYNQQQYNQMPQNNNQQYQMQNLQQNFANFSIQEPIKQFAPYNPEEAKNNQENKNLPDEMLCVVCLSVQRSHLFTPCMHLCACGPCSTDVINQQKGCPMCRAPIQSSVKVFMS